MKKYLILAVVLVLFVPNGLLAFDYVIDNSTFYPIPTMAKPAKGESVTEPNFHTMITRITDKAIDGYSAGTGDGMATEYCRSDPENCNGTYLLLAVKEYFWYLYDAKTFQMIKKLDMAHLGYSHGYDGGPIEPRWDANDPNVFYFVLPGPSARPDVNKATFRRYTIKDRLTYPNTADEVTVVHDFKNELPGAIAIATDTEGEPSKDGRIWAWKVKGSSGSLLAYVVYDLQQDEIIARWDNPPYNYNWISVSPSGKYIGLSSRNSPVAAFGQIIIQIDGAVGHSDWAIDSDGNDCRVYQNTHHDRVSMASFDGSITGGGGQIDPIHGLPAYSLPVTHLIDFPMPCCHGIHFSGSNYSKPGWAVVSISTEIEEQWLNYQVFMLELNPNKCTGKYHPWNPSEISRFWKCDEQPTVWRITSLCAHHPIYFAGYASINNEGTKIFWSSDWDEEGAPIETYMIELPETWHEDLTVFEPNKGPLAPSNLKILNIK